MRINDCGAFLYFCVVHATNRCLARAARPNDIVIVSRSINGLPLDRDLIEAMLFTSGWPALVFPRAEFQNIIGRDGGARAARAVGDAMPLLTRAERVEIVHSRPCARLPPPSRSRKRASRRSRSPPKTFRHAGGSHSRRNSIRTGSAKQSARARKRSKKPRSFQTRRNATGHSPRSRPSIRQSPA